MSQLDLNLLKNQIETDLKSIKSKEDLDFVFDKYLSKKTGEITNILRSLKDLPVEKKKVIAVEANKLNKFLRDELFFLSKNLTEDNTEITLDITQPGKKNEIGHLHPITKTERRVYEIFNSMGFDVIHGTEIEDEWYNFDALNIPKDHPARDMWDTFWIKDDFTNKKEKLLLRTHTSPAQIHYMQKHNPPLRVIVPGKVFRHEATDASHEFDFYQVEGLMIDENISVANFKMVITEFLRMFFGKETKIRLRPSFFPFTEPSFEVDASCFNCNGKGCSVCNKTGWIELMGAGMVHPNVFKAAGLNPKNYQGFAFGIGLDRLAMLKYKIKDIRLFKSGDLRFLKQF